MVRTHVSHPGPRRCHQAAVDAARDRMILYGGFGPVEESERGRANGPPARIHTSSSTDGAVHALDLRTMSWQRIYSYGVNLPSTFGHVMVSAPDSHALIVHGGVPNGLVGQSRPASSLWSCDLETMRVEHPEGETVPERFSHGACYCRHRRALLCVGGSSRGKVDIAYATAEEYDDAFLIHVG